MVNRNIWLTRKEIISHSENGNSFEWFLLIHYFHIFHRYVDKLMEKKEDWSLCFRGGKLLRGHQTNNMAEANMCIIKDIILNRYVVHWKMLLQKFILHWHKLSIDRHIFISTECSTVQCTYTVLAFDLHRLFLGFLGLLFQPARWKYVIMLPGSDRNWWGMADVM